MKRLPALMLSVFMLTLLCLPTSAANNSANMKVLGSEDIPVKLNINDNNMVDVTIEWEVLKYTYDGKEFTPTVKETMPQITVINNSTGKAITVSPSFNLTNNFDFGKSEFDLFFSTTSDKNSTDGESLTSILVNEGDSTSFYAIPIGNPLGGTAQLVGAGERTVGILHITIGLPTS